MTPPAHATPSWWKTPAPWAVLFGWVAAGLTIADPTWVSRHPLGSLVPGLAVIAAALVTAAGLLHHLKWPTLASAEKLVTELEPILTSIEAGHLDPADLLAAVTTAVSDILSALGIALPGPPTAARVDFNPQLAADRRALEREAAAYGLTRPPPPAA